MPALQVRKQAQRSEGTGLSSSSESVAGEGIKSRRPGSRIFVPNHYCLDSLRLMMSNSNEMVFES